MDAIKLVKRMKSIKEKAKAYDKAIEKLRSLHDDYDTVSTLIDVKEELENIFPELKLKDSDEKIRKEIVSAINIYCSEYHRGTKVRNNMLAWLEKQGEQKPADKIQLGKKYKCIASPRYSAFVKGEIYKPEDKFLCSLMNFCSDCFEPIEDGEKKSADKAESNLLTVERAKEMSPFMRSGFENEYAAWSEEDEKTWKELIEEVKDQLDSVPSPDCMGKEDEKVLKQLTRWLDWLKSIKDRHTWKPSDEQIKALEAMLTVSPQSPAITSALLGLYEQLKKLKE